DQYLPRNKERQSGVERFDHPHPCLDMTELVGRVAPAPGERLFHPDLLAGSEPVREPLSHARKEHLQVVGPAAAVPRVKTDRIRVRPLSTELSIVELFDDLQAPSMRSVIVEGENGGK